jgi:hypothetical protein
MDLKQIGLVAQTGINAQDCAFHASGFGVIIANHFSYDSDFESKL